MKKIKLLAMILFTTLNLLSGTPRLETFVSVSKINEIVITK